MTTATLIVFYLKHDVRAMKTLLVGFVCCLMIFNANAAEEIQKYEIVEEVKEVASEVNELYISGKITESFYVTAASTIFAIIYGVLYDQITTRICLEYYMTGNHPRLINSDSPTLHGLIWGVITTWWVGLGLGIPTALVSQFGSWPSVSAQELFPALLFQFFIIPASSFLIGSSAYLYMRYSGFAPQLNVMGSHLLQSPAVRQKWLTVGIANSAGYLVGLVNSIIIWCVIIHKRYQMSSME